jgi:hypothetical protein
VSRGDNTHLGVASDGGAATEMLQETEIDDCDSSANRYDGLAQLGYSVAWFVGYTNGLVWLVGLLRLRLFLSSPFLFFLF